MNLKSKTADIREDFYVTGGTLSADAPSYVARQADEALYTSLVQGEFCYVLTARQMGKSSLMVRTAARLRENSCAVAVLDLTSLGQNLTPAQWYRGLLERIGRQIGREDEIEAFWLSRDDDGVLQRFLLGLTKALEACAPRRLVIFVDEIDIVRSLPFPTDEFFAAIRECYNRRATDPVFSRLTFCLLGVATPSQLIADKRNTPFNIGRRIELRDFTEAETVSLASGLDAPAKTRWAIAERAYHWTGGHPYLTQRLFRTLAEADGPPAPAGIDRHCRDLFLSPGARERDDNLLFVRERLLGSGEELASVLDLYSRVYAHKRVPEDDTSPLIGHLRLSGLVRSQPTRSGSRLVPRNRIYARVFDRAWIRVNMPDAELQRQKFAFRRGVLQTTLGATAVLGIMGLLAFQARQATVKANRFLGQSKQETLNANRLLYTVNINMLSTEWDRRNIYQMLVILRDTAKFQERGFEWYYWNRLATFPAAVLSVQHSRCLLKVNCPNADAAIRFDSPGFRYQPGDSFPSEAVFIYGGKVIAVKITTAKPNGEESVIRFWSATTGREVFPLRASALAEVKRERDRLKQLLGKLSKQHTRWNERRFWDLLTVRGSGASKSGERLILKWNNGTATIYDAATLTGLFILHGHRGVVSYTAISPDSRHAVTIGRDGKVLLWNISDRYQPIVLRSNSAVDFVAFSLNGKEVLTGDQAEMLQSWSAISGKQANSIKFSPLTSPPMLSSPLGSTNISEEPTGNDKPVRESLKQAYLFRSMVMLKRDDHKLKVLTSDRQSIWDAKTGKKIFAPHERRANTYNRKEIVRWINHLSLPDDHFVIGNNVDFIVNKRCCITMNQNDRQVTVRSLSGKILHTVTSKPGFGYTECADVSSDGVQLVVGSEESAIVWNLVTGQKISEINGRHLDFKSCAFSRDGKRLITGSLDGTAKVWDVATGRELITLKGHTGPILAVAFSPDGQHVATGSADGTTRVW